MGVIKRQGIKHSIVGYTATAVGALSGLFIYPLDEEVYGLALFLTNTAFLLSTIMSGGIPSLAVRYFPEFKTADGKHKGFFGLLQLGILLAFPIFLAFGAWGQEWVIWALERMNMDAQLVFNYIGPILALTFLTTQINFLTEYTSNYHRIVVPVLFSNLLFKLALPVLVLLSAWQLLGRDGFTLGVIVYHALGVAGIAAYLYLLGGVAMRIDWQTFTWRKIREMGEYAVYGIFSSVGNVLAFRIDLIMISTILGLGTAGIFGIAQFIGASIEIPKRALYGIVRPILNQALKADQYEEVLMIYQKTSLNLSLVGLFLTALVMGSLDDLFRLTRDYESLSAAASVVFLTALAKLVDMASSTNGLIIYYSRYYRFNFVTVLLLAVCNVAFNLYFIPRIGISGAALATVLSMLLANTARMLFVWWKWRMQPFTLAHAWALGITALAYGAGELIPDSFVHPLLSIVLRSALIAGVFLPMMFYSRLSTDVNELALNALQQAKKWWKGVSSN